MEQMSPHEILMTTGRCKYGHGNRHQNQMRADMGLQPMGYARWTIMDAFELKRKSKVTQMRAIAKAFGLCPEWILTRNWTVRKSGNRRYHPATYTLEILS